MTIDKELHLEIDTDRLYVPSKKKRSFMRCKLCVANENSQRWYIK